MPIRITPAVKALLIACFALFIVQHSIDLWVSENAVRNTLALIPSEFFGGWVWQLLTYSFLHGDVMHLFLNLMMLAFIGGELEAAWGTPRFLRYYFLCVAGGGFLYLLLALLGVQGARLPMIGASAGIYGLLMAYGLIFGERVLLFMMLFPMKAKHFVWILAAIELMSTVFSGRGGLSSAAHLGGMVTGFVWLWGGAAFRVWQKRRAAEGGKPPKKRRSADHLKLIINNKPDGDKPGPRSGDKPTTWH